MTCHQCHAPLTEHVSFCPSCGASLKEQWHTAAQQAPPQWQQAQQTPPNQPFYSNATAPPPYPQPPTDPQSSPKEQHPCPANVEPLLFALAYIPILFWLPLAFDHSKSAFGRSVANQGLLLLIVSVLLNFVSSAQPVFSWLPAIPLFPSTLFQTVVSILSGVLFLAVFVCTIVGFIKGLQRQCYKIPFIGHFKLIS